MSLKNQTTSLLFSTIFLALSLAGWAQDKATIAGTVTDTSGAVIPHAKVTVSNPDKGFTRELVTNADGVYTAAKVPIGTYVITVEAAGFQRLVRSEITLTVGQTLRVDLQLTVGQITQEVTVIGNVPRVETDTGTISHVVTGSQMVDLNLNGRSFAGLYLLVPGVVINNGLNLQTSPWFTPISFNGGRWQNNKVEIDGAFNNDMGGGGSSLVNLPSIDSIAEFRISTSNYGADLGQAGAAIIEVATKSGTRDFHGGAYDFVRNDKFNANDWFTNRRILPPGEKAPKTPLKWNDFGYFLGGPFYIPGHYNTDKSKTFFFWSHEWRRYRQGTVINTTVPSLRMREGDFSECNPNSPNFNPVAASGCVLPLNPDTRQPFPGDIVPVNPNGKALLDAYVPRPNSGVVGYVAAPSNPTNWHQEQIRVDQNLSNKTSAFARFTKDSWFLGVMPPERSANPGLGAGQFDTVQSRRFRLGWNGTVHITHNFNPRLLNDFSASYVDNELIFQEPLVGPSNVARSFNKPSAWTANNLFPANASNRRLPGINVSGGLPRNASLVMSGTDSPNGTNADPTYTLKDNVVHVVGRHTLKSGFLLQWFQKNEVFGFYTQGVMSFRGGNPTGTRNALADIFLGRIAQYTEGTQTVNSVAVGGYPKGYFRYTDLEPYFQDDWKVSRRLTLNLGIRYYWFDPHREVSNPSKAVTFIPRLYNPAVQARLDAAGNIVPGAGFDYTMFGNGLITCGAEGVARSCTVPSRGNVAPRIGFAFDPTGSGKTSIRGGYGIFYDIGSGGDANAEGIQGNPPVALAPSGFNIVGYQDIKPGALGTIGISTIPDHLKWPTVQQFSLSVQREFPGNNLLSVAYVGSLGRHLSRSRDLNVVPIGVTTMNVPVLAGTTGCDAAGNCDAQSILIRNLRPTIFFAPYRGYSSITMVEHTAISSYNALQADFRHTFGRGLTLQAAYTWAHNLDDASSSGFQCVDPSNLRRCYGTSNLNRSHSLVTNYIYSLPFFKNTSRPVVKNMLGGWRLSGITSFFTGQPITPGCGFNQFRSGIGGGIVCNSLGRLEVKKGMVNDPQSGPTPTWFDPAKFGQPAMDQLRADGQPGMFGYMGRNVLRGPGRNNWDIALLKEFLLPWLGAEHSTLQFRLETFNSFNHPQWQGVRASCAGNTPAGEPCSGPNNISNGQIVSAWPARVMQLALKLSF